jgi:molybdopterin molybdotransferase
MQHGAGRIRDVRMRGFAQRSEVHVALGWIDAHAARLDSEEVALDDASGRTLAGDLVAPLDVPGFDRSAMDGYALIGAETAGATEYNLLTFAVLGQALPDSRSQARCARRARCIMTGSPVPPGSDAVVPAEYASESNGEITIDRPVAPGQHVGHRGEDIREGSPALQAGRRLRPQDLGLIASLGLARVEVVKQPRARILVTGNEVKAPGAPKGQYQVYDANSFMLRPCRTRRRCRRRRAACLMARCHSRRPHRRGRDLSGGSSVGSEDHAPQLIARPASSRFTTAMRPSVQPASDGSATRSCSCCPATRCRDCAYDFLPAARFDCRWAFAAWPHRTRQCVVARKIVSAIGRVDYCRVRIADGRVEPLALSGASILSSTTRADGFVIVPAESEGYGPDSEVNVYLYD